MPTDSEFGDLRDVEAVHRGRRIALLTDGQILPVTGWFCMDAELRDEPCEPSQAVSCVAGPDKDGQWYSIDLSCFDPERAQ